MKASLFGLITLFSFCALTCKKATPVEPPLPPVQDQGVKITDGIQPSISPDGQWIAFSLFGSIYICDTAGNQRRKLTSGTNDIIPRFSPDGMKVGFVRAIDNNYGQIYCVTLADSQIVMLSGAYEVSLYFLTFIFTRNPIWDWSPAGDNIAFIQQDAESNVYLKIMHGNGDGSVTGNYGLINTLALTGGNYAPSFSWAPDGLHLACISNSIPGTSHVGIITIGLDSIKEFSDNTGELFPTWTPDDKAVFYEMIGYSNTILKDVTTGEETLLPGGGKMDSPKISPDMKYVVSAWNEPKSVDNLGEYVSLLQIYNITNRSSMPLTTFGDESLSPSENYSFEWEHTSQYVYFERLQSVWKIKI
jgi:Tol biopolymer transport system component